MKHFLLTFLSLALSASAVGALDISNPQDPIYAVLQQWQKGGVIRKLPPLRPYPQQVVREALKEVLDSSASDQDKAQAQKWLNGLSFETPSLEAEALFGANLEQDWLSRNLLGIQHNFSLLENVTGQYRLQFSGNRFPSGENPYLQPLGETPDYDIVADDGVVAGVNVLPYLSAGLTWGTADTYLQSGYGRTEFGPFGDNGIFLSGKSPEAAYYSLFHQEGIFTYQAIYEVLGATDAFGRAPPKGVYDNKNFLLHEVGFQITDFLKVTANETVLFGNFDLMYFLPVSGYFYSQRQAGFGNNAFLGGTTTVTIGTDVVLSAGIQLDDINFGQFARLNLNSKFKAGLEGSLTWSPLTPWLRMVQLDYTAVMPFAYTHVNFANTRFWEELNSTQDRVANFANYTNNGTSVGPALKPNSDRVTLSVQSQPLPGLTLGLRGRLIRHGNANEGTIYEGWTGKYYLDNGASGGIAGNGIRDGGETFITFPMDEGGLYDTGYHVEPDADGNFPVDEDSKPQYAFQELNPFLTQSVLETALSAQLEGRYELGLDEMQSLFLQGSLTVEQIWNHNLVEGESLQSVTGEVKLGYSLQF